MLNKLRNFSKGKLAGVLVAIIIIPFVFWGMGSVFSGGNKNNIAKINNHNVSTQDFADIHISSTSQQRGEIRKLSVVIEVKGCWHEMVNSSMETQLKGQYLHSSASRHGIYLVTWFPQEQWDDDDTRKASARRKCPDLPQSISHFKDQAKQLSDGEILISSFVLDCSVR